MDPLVEISELKKRVKRLESGVATNFLGLTDTPGSYSNQAAKLVKVNAAQNALEFASTAKALFFGRLTNNFTMTTSGGVYKIPINVADVDTASGFDAGNNRYIIQASGYFMLVGQAWIDGIPSATDDLKRAFQVFLRINGASRQSPCTNIQGWMSGWDWWGASVVGGDVAPKAIWPVKHLNTNDYIELNANAYQNNVNIHGAENYCGHKTFLSVIEL